MLDILFPFDNVWFYSLLPDSNPLSFIQTLTFRISTFFLSKTDKFEGKKCKGTDSGLRAKRYPDPDPDPTH